MTSQDCGCTKTLTADEYENFVDVEDEFCGQLEAQAQKSMLAGLGMDANVYQPVQGQSSVSDLYLGHCSAKRLMDCFFPRLHSVFSFG